MPDPVRDMKDDDTGAPGAHDTVRHLDAAGRQLAPLVLTPDLRVVPERAPEPAPIAPARSLAETVAGLETTLAGYRDDWEAEAATAAFPPPPPFTAATSTPPNAFAPAPGPDPDALRDMVAELVRDELRGNLGVQITHTVRKLVRAEVARALAARDLR